MYFKDRFAHTNSVCRDAKLLEVPGIANLQTDRFVHKSVHLLPMTLGFTVMQHRATRRPLYLRLPRHRTTHAQRSVLLRGSKSWNNLPDPLITDPNSTSFKNNVFTTYIN